MILSLLFISCISKSKEVDGDKILNKKNEVYELRIYYTHEGKFDDIISRFENHTTKLFEKHGFTNVGYWPFPNLLPYLPILRLQVFQTFISPLLSLLRLIDES